MVSVTVAERKTSDDDVVETALALESKNRRVEQGFYGPEGGPRDDGRWIGHQTAPQRPVEEVG